MPSNWFAFDKIRALARANNIYQSERIFQDQPQLDRMTVGGDFLDFNTQSAILDQTSIQINRMARYMDYEVMDQTGEISLSLDLYADESSMVDSERKRTLIIRARNRRLKRALESFFFGTLQWDSHCRSAVRYLCKYGDCPFEIVTNVNRTGVSALKHMSVYNFTRVETRYGDLVGFFYQDPMTPQPVFLHPWQVVHMRLTSYESLYQPYGRCAKLDSRVWTSTGSKQLKDVLPGDEVYSFDIEKQIPVLTKVVRFINSGKKSILKFKTRHRELAVTPEHPVLAVLRDQFVQTKSGLTRDTTTKQYVLASDLKIGDRLILPKLKQVGSNISVDKHILSGHAGKKMDLPDNVTIDFAKLMGFLIGDGWISKAHPTILSWAEGEHPEINQKYKDIISSFGFVGEPTRSCREGKKYGNFNYRSIELAQTMAKMGLSGRAWEKRIPQWVFSATIEIQRAFLEGLIDADGSTNIDKWNCERIQLEVTSEELVKDVKVLLDQMGLKCGNVSKRNRGKNNKAVFDGVEYERRPSWIVYWYNSKLPSGDLRQYGKAFGGRGRTYYKYNSDDYVVEPIISIEDGGVVEVGDIQVESDHHNFICDGVVIHNSVIDGGRRAFKQLRLMEDSALIYRITRGPEKRKFKIPVGDIPPKDVPGFLNQVARQFKRQRFYNPTTGSFDERYSPLIQEDDIFLPFRPDGNGPDVEIMQGGKNLSEIEDIEYFKKKMIAPTKIPFARVGIGEGAGQANDKSLSQSSSEFAKAVQWVQREVAKSLTKAAIVHLALQGFGIEDLKGFEIALTASSAMEDLYRMETWNTRVNVMTGLKELGWFPKEWIVTHFTDLSPDEIEELKEAESQAGGGGMPGLGGGGGLDNLGGQLGDDPNAAPEGMPGEVPGEDGEMLAPDPEEAGEQPLEGYDLELEQRVINELNDADLKSKRRLLIEKLFNKLGKSLESDDKEFDSGFDGIVESKELDGLSQTPPGANAGTIHDPNGDGVLFEWSVPEELRNSAIQDTLMVLREDDRRISLVGPEPAGFEPDETVIKESDLPEPLIED